MVVRPIPTMAGLLGALFCSLILAVEFALGFHLRGLTLNLALGIAWLLVMAFSLASYGWRGLWALLSVPLGVFMITSSSVQIVVACSVNLSNCP